MACSLLFEGVDLNQIAAMAQNAGAGGMGGMGAPGQEADFDYGEEDQPGMPGGGIGPNDPLMGFMANPQFA